MFTNIFYLHEEQMDTWQGATDGSNGEYDNMTNPCTHLLVAKIKYKTALQSNWAAICHFGDLDTHDHNVSVHPHTVCENKSKEIAKMFCYTALSHITVTKEHTLHTCIENIPMYLSCTLTFLVLNIHRLLVSKYTTKISPGKRPIYVGHNQKSLIQP